jgi:hypothetical protein
MKKIALILSVFIFIGCNSSDNSETIEVTTLKNNIWLSKICYFTGRFDQDGNLYKTYHKSTYKFTENKIVEKIEDFSDENCTNSLNSYSDYSLTYYDLGLKESKNDYDIYNIKIEEQTKVQDAFYAISQNRLCFSKSIYAFNVEEQWTDLNGNVYTSTNSGLHIFSTRDNTIDYNNCLIKK